MVHADNRPSTMSSQQSSNIVPDNNVKDVGDNNLKRSGKDISSTDNSSSLKMTHPSIKVTLPPQPPSCQPDVARPLPDVPDTPLNAKVNTSDKDTSVKSTHFNISGIPETLKGTIMHRQQREHLVAATEFWNKTQQHRKHGFITLSNTLPLHLDSLIAVACHNVSVKLHATELVAERLQDACDILAGSVNSNSLLYAGLTYIEENISNFQGPSRKRKVWEDKEMPPGSMPKFWLRAAMACFISLVLQGRNFVKLQTLQIIVDCLNQDITPLVPIGDETAWRSSAGPMEYVIAMIQGSRKVAIQFGEENSHRPYTADQGLKKCGLMPIQLSNFESYMITHSPAFQLGVSAVGVCQANQLVYNCQLLTAFTLDVAERDAEWADDRPEEPPVYREIRANIRAFTRGSASIYGMKKDNDLFENNLTTQIFIEAFCSFPYRFNSVLQDLKLAREQLEFIIASTTSSTLDDVDMLAENMFFEEQLPMSDENDDDNASNESNHGSIPPSDKGGLAAQLANQRLARRIIETLQAYTHGIMFEIVSCMQKTRNSLATILQQTHTSVWSLTNTTANKMALPDNLAYDGEGSSPVIEQCVHEIQDIDSQIAHLMSTFVNHTRGEETLQNRGDGTSHIQYVAARSAISVGQIAAMITRQMAIQSYVLAQAADLRAIHDRILLFGFERVIVNSMPLLGPKVYAQLSQDLILSIQDSLLSAVRKSWVETSQVKPAMALDDRCSRAADAALPAMIEYLIGCHLSDVSGTFAEWRKSACQRFQHWIRYWPKVLKVESERDMGTGSKLVYMLVREKCGVKIDKSGIIHSCDLSLSSHSYSRNEGEHNSSSDIASMKDKQKDKATIGKAPNPRGIPAPVTRIYKALREGAMDEIAMQILMDDLVTPLPPKVLTNKKSVDETPREPAGVVSNYPNHSKNEHIIEPFPPPAPLPRIVSESKLPIHSPVDLYHLDLFKQFDSLDPPSESRSFTSPTTPATLKTSSTGPTSSAGNVSVYEDPLTYDHVSTAPPGLGLLNSPMPRFRAHNHISPTKHSQISSSLVTPSMNERFAPASDCSSSPRPSSNLHYVTQSTTSPADAMDTDETTSSMFTSVSQGKAIAEEIGSGNTEEDALLWDEAYRELDVQKCGPETDDEMED